jgi:mevalonate kinase
MLFGEHAVVYGQPCIVTAVNQRISISLKVRNDRNVRINAPDVSLTDYVEKIDDLGKEGTPKGSRFISCAVKNFFEFSKVSFGLDIETKSDFSSKFGFGSSSAVTVAAIKALSQLIGKDMDNGQVFDLSYKTVLDVQGVGSGFDVAAAVWGKTIYFIKGGEKTESVQSSSLPLVVGYTGIKADTPTLVRQVADFYQQKKEFTSGLFTFIGKIVKESKTALTGGNFEKLGLLMNRNQEILQELGVSSPILDKLIQASLQAGAYGAKLSGAGGGDCMIAIVSPQTKHSVERAIEGSGGEVLRVQTQAEGVRSEKI